MSGQFVPASLRAVDVWNHIQGLPSTVIMTKPKIVNKTSTTPATELDPQVVRIESEDKPAVVAGVAGAAPRFHATVFGVRDHPDPAIVDTDMEEGYTFTHEGDAYRCINAKLLPGAVQGRFVVNG